MTTAQIVNAILFSLWPIMIGIAFLLFHFLIQRLPAHTRLAHRQFANESAVKVEQQNPTMPGKAKKALAMTEVAKLCHDYGLPEPKPDSMDTHIESAVYRMNTALKPGQ
jgi:hypothetical protein